MAKQRQAKEERNTKTDQTLEAGREATQGRSSFRTRTVKVKLLSIATSLSRSVSTLLISGYKSNL